MSLFSNIFKANSDNAASSLFSNSNKFKTTEKSLVPLTTVIKSNTEDRVSDAALGSGGKPQKRKRADSMTDAPKKDEIKSTKSRKDVRPKSIDAREQAQKVEKLAKAARRQNSENLKQIDEEELEQEQTDNDDSDSEMEYSDEEEEEADRNEKIFSKQEKYAQKNDDFKDEDDDEKEDENEENKLERTIFVGNLPSDVKKKSLLRLFSKYGPIASVRIRSVALKVNTTLPRRTAVASGSIDTTRAPPHAYIVFETQSAATSALEWNMREWKDRHLRVDMAAVASKENQSSTVRYDPVKSVFIGNVHIEAQDEDLIRFLINGLGAGVDVDELQAVRIVRDVHTSLGKGIAYALFKTSAGRRAALALSGREFKGRPLRITSVEKGRSSSVLYNGTARNTHGKGRASWQGVTATKSGRSRGSTDKAMKMGGRKDIGLRNGRGKSTLAVNNNNNNKKKTGKRPAVAARKEKQLQKSIKRIRK